VKLPRVAVRKRLTRAIRGGHPWVYREALAAAPQLPDGTTVLVVDADDRALGCGFWDATSPIAVRVLGEVRQAELPAEIDRRIGNALGRRLASLDRGQTDAFRWIHGEADGLPGIHLDVYGHALSLRFDGAGARAFYRDLPERLRDAAGRASLSVETIVERRPRGGDVADGGVATTVSGAPPAEEIEVRENGLRFGVDLLRGQKGGLFLDQRENRALVRTLAADRRVLNLFGYTGGFSIYAAAGGARETITVDAAAPAIAAARRNFERNGLPIDGRARFAAEDAFAYLTRAAAEGARFDLVISDPPSFAPNRRALTTGLSAYRRLHRLCAAVAAPGAIFCAASCSSHVDREAFLATVHDGVREAGRRAELRELRGAGFDHPAIPQFPEGGYLKFAVLAL
jgi:23S rRNA (cytosine1962-C5)-methyltransferase